MGLADILPRPTGGSCGTCKHTKTMNGRSCGTCRYTNTTHQWIVRLCGHTNTIHRGVIRALQTYKHNPSEGHVGLTDVPPRPTGHLRLEGHVGYADIPTRSTGRSCGPCGHINTIQRWVVWALKTYPHHPLGVNA